MIKNTLGFKPWRENQLPPADNFKPWSHVPNLIPLDQGVTATAALKNESPAVKALRVGEAKVRPARDFSNRKSPSNADLDD